MQGWLFETYTINVWNVILWYDTSDVWTVPGKYSPSLALPSSLVSFQLLAVMLPSQPRA